MYRSAQKKCLQPPLNGEVVWGQEPKNSVDLELHEMSRSTQEKCNNSRFEYTQKCIKCLYQAYI